MTHGKNKRLVEQIQGTEHAFLKEGGDVYIYIYIYIYKNMNII